jgi:hypothetical protein
MAEKKKQKIVTVRDLATKLKIEPKRPRGAPHLAVVARCGITVDNTIWSLTDSGSYQNLRLFESSAPKAGKHGAPRPITNREGRVSEEQEKRPPQGTSVFTKKAEPRR